MWKLVYDGLSLAMIQSPDNRIFSLRELKDGWQGVDDNDVICRKIVEALNNEIKTRG